MKTENATVILFLLFSALLTTIWDYQFGQMDHVEHLPLLFRAENPEYLKNDSFLNAYSENFDPRFYYTQFILLLKKLLPLPLLFFLLTYLTNLLIAFSGYRIAKYFFGGEKWAGLIAVLFMMTIPTIELGSVSEIHAPYLTPNALSFSLILFSLSFIFRKAWLQAGFMLGLSSLIHPLAGPECTFIFLGIAALEQMYSNGFNFNKYRNFLQGSGIALFFAALSVAPFFLNSADTLDAGLFIEIYAHFRVPHHVLPSAFMSPEEKTLAVKLLLLLVFVWIAWFRLEQDKRQHQIIVLTYILGFLLLALAGYVFVEIYPIKIAVIAQTFRLLYILKWFLLLLLGGYIGDMLWKSTHQNRIYAWSALLSSLAMPYLIWIFGLWGLSSIMHRRFKIPQLFSALEITLIIGMGVYGWYLSWQQSAVSANVYLWSFMLFALPVISILNIPKIQTLIWPMAAAALLSYWTTHPRTEGMTPFYKAISRQYDLKDLPAVQLELSAKIKELTPDSAIIIAPPMFGELRYLADRALLVTFKTLPFGGKQMLEWKEMVFDCYGWTDLKGFNAVLYAFEPNYKIIDKNRLLMLHEKYGANYAVLYKETKAEFPVLYENKIYQLVLISNPK